MNVAFFWVAAVCTLVRHVDAVTPAVVPAFERPGVLVVGVAVDCWGLRGRISCVGDGLLVEAVDVRIVEVDHQVFVGLVG
mgnify:CR=1 FL=1